MLAPADTLDILPPHDIDAELCLLASLMLAGEDRTLFEETRAGVTVASFFDGDNGILFQVVTDLANRGTKIDVITVREQLIRRGLFDDVGGNPYLARIVNLVPSPAHGPHYAGIVKEHAALRALLSLADGIRTQVNRPSDRDRALDIAADVAGKLARLNADAGAAQYISGGDAALNVVSALERGTPPLLKLGFKPLDDAMGGIALGEMMIIGARPSMGKSTICRQILLDSAMMGQPTLLVSLEESREKVARNLLSRLAHVENSRLRRGNVGKAEWQPLTEGVATLSNLPLYIADRAFSMSAIRSVVSMLVAKHGIRLVLVDYLQRVRAQGKDRYAQVTEASQELSTLWKELNVAGVVPAQLNRDAPKRDNKRPGMTDLRESGQIEQDADQIVMLHREDYYRATGESAEGSEPDGIAEFIFVKFRDGARGGTVKCKANLAYQCFDESEQYADTDPF